MRATRTVLLDLPDALLDVLGSDDAAPAKAKEALLLELVREAHIGQGFAAEDLGLTRWNILDLMVEHQIASGPETSEELPREIEDLGVTRRNTGRMPVVSDSSPRILYVKS